MSLADIQTELAELRPASPIGLLTNEEKDRIIERSFLGLYRWYVSRSQKTRNWNPNTDFDWRKFRTDHSEKMNTILEGFFATEQYVPDYVFTFLKVIRKSHGRSHFHIRWGSEEEKHADLWENTLLFSRFRTPQWIEDYKHALREQEWELPWDDPLRMVFYTVIQERATQVNYLNAGLIANGKWEGDEFAGDVDPILANASKIIAIDEAAHYNFFLEGARLYLYYYPTQALEALADVINSFAMPAQTIIPNYDKFGQTLVDSGVFGARAYVIDTLDVALKNLGIEGRKKLMKGIKKIRQVPTEDGTMRNTMVMETLDYATVEGKVQKLFGRINDYEKKTGHYDISPLIFRPSGLG